MNVYQYATALRAAAPVHAARAAAGIDFHRGKDAICLSLASFVERLGRFSTEKQQRYADSLIRWAQPATTATPAAQISPIALGRITALFTAARSHNLLRPKIVVSVPVRAHADGAVSTQHVLITLKPSRIGRVPEVVYVYGGQRADWVGVIDARGAFTRRAACRELHLSALAAFGDDPLRIAAAHGHRTGACCFCRRRLTDSRSVAMGYGPVCAVHFGLDWGTDRAASRVAYVTPTRIEPTPPAPRRLTWRNEIEHEGSHPRPITPAPAPRRLPAVAQPRQTPVPARVITDEDDWFR